MKNSDRSVEVYMYQESAKEPLSPWPDLPIIPSASNEPREAASAGPPPPPDRDPAQEKRRQQADLARSFEEGRRQGLEEGLRTEREESARRIKKAETQWKEQLSSLLAQFGSERDRYLQNVEHEVVELALAIAARILRREAQMDPLLLTGAVRVALGQLAETTHVKLVVPQADFELWKETLAHIPNLALKPILQGDDNLHAGRCVLSTELGSVDLGVHAQLAEIERGFFDRRDAVKAPNRSISGPETEA